METISSYTMFINATEYANQSYKLPDGARYSKQEIMRGARKDSLSLEDRVLIYKMAHRLSKFKGYRAAIAKRFNISQGLVQKLQYNYHITSLIKAGYYPRVYRMDFWVNEFNRFHKTGI